MLPHCGNHNALQPHTQVFLPLDLGTEQVNLVRSCIPNVGPMARTESVLNINVLNCSKPESPRPEEA